MNWIQKPRYYCRCRDQATSYNLMTRPCQTQKYTPTPTCSPTFGIPSSNEPPENHRGADEKSCRLAFGRQLFYPLKFTYLKFSPKFFLFSIALHLVHKYVNLAPTSLTFCQFVTPQLIANSLIPTFNTRKKTLHFMDTPLHC